MALNAAAVEILIEKSKFEPEVAIGIAEAIEISMTHQQFVTVPILDARLHELRAEMRIGLASLEGKLATSVQELKSAIVQSSAELETKIECSKAELETKIECSKAGLETKIERSKAELVRWVFVVTLGNVALVAVAALLNVFQHFR
jgi:hypothetical protein